MFHEVSKVIRYFFEVRGPTVQVKFRECRDRVLGWIGTAGGMKHAGTSLPRVETEAVFKNWVKAARNFGVFVKEHWTSTGGDRVLYQWNTVHLN